jgi:lipid II:glycine glycyltransferase (peptidoglycan interpeptide bridge formation enzyme)
MGGFSGIKIGFWKFSYIVFPAGPLFNSNITEVEKFSFFKWFLEYKLKNSRKIQFATEVNLDLYYKNLNKGKSIRFVYLNSGFNLIPLFENEQEQLINFKTKVRRDINASLRKGMNLVQVVNTADLKKVYDVFKLNSLEAGYKIRPYWFYRKSWIESLNEGQSIFFMAMKDNQIKGAIWLIDCGKRLHYVMGGTVKEKPDLYVGYFLQWHAIKLSLSKKYTTYNISVGGSEGVKQFKSDFGAIINFKVNYLWIKG